MEFQILVGMVCLERPRYAATRGSYTDGCGLTALGNPTCLQCILCLSCPTHSYTNCLRTKQECSHIGKCMNDILYALSKILKV